MLQALDTLLAKTDQCVYMLTGTCYQICPRCRHLTLIVALDLPVNPVSWQEGLVSCEETRSGERQNIAQGHTGSWGAGILMDT